MDKRAAAWGLTDTHFAPFRIARIAAPGGLGIILCKGGVHHDATAVFVGILGVLAISRASHLFSEPGALEQVAEAASTWFAEQLEEMPALA